MFITGNAMNNVDTDPTGTWDFTVQAPDMTYSGEIEITGEDGDYSATLSVAGATIEASDLTIEDGEFSFGISFQGMACDIEGTIEGDKMDAVISVEGMELVLKGTRSE